MCQGDLVTVADRSSLAQVFPSVETRWHAAQVRRMCKEKVTTQAE